ncbi:MAG: hypothetical protein P8177_14150 [Gemmatimonadota bacterium]
MMGNRNARRRVLAVVLSAVAAVAIPQAASAQEEAARNGDALYVYLDCSAGRWGVCDLDMYRQEITFVNWVREPQDAEVHVIMTSQNVGGGGNRYVLDFLGRGELAGMEDELSFTSSSTDVEDEIVDGLVRTLSLGLVRYATAAGYGQGLQVLAVDGAGGTEEPALSQDDPWNFWVFDLDGDVQYESEDLRETREFGFRVTANRTTEEWKLNLRTGGDWFREEFQIPLDDSGTDEPQYRTVENIQDSWDVSAFGVKSLGPHMGLGAEFTANNSTQLNRDLLVGLATGFEYNYFPYSESNRRELIGRYVVSVQVVEYQDTTVFDQIEETVYRHEVNLDYNAREPWGNARIGVGVSQYLDRTDAWSFRVDGFVNYRILRGLSINIRGEYEKVKDQIYLSQEELDDEDILLGRRRLPTEAQTELRVGLSYSFGSIYNNAYSFGSIYNNAVNERFSWGLF